jgi:hypothetical protein
VEPWLREQQGKVSQQACLKKFLKKNLAQKYNSFGSVWKKLRSNFKFSYL